MIQPLYALVFSEVAVILVLLFRTPLRKPLLMLLDRLKQGRGPVVASTAGGTLFVIMISLLFNITTIQNRTLEGGGVNPTDQVLLANQLLEASLLGFALFLGLMIDRIHYYIKEVRMLRKHLEAVKKSEDVQSKEKGKSKVVEEDD
ncbi:B-cell receptor-associated 31-like [Striga asiatica]|uniref:Endoplasmic reticulum transmembrane protein n=1 Tax=Striga asiatica TaxID=4170 RepID=A0A5A7PKV0_STRAF|nr:B-cell receptor-associated 31-like [Striga asiatica]